MRGFFFDFSRTLPHAVGAVSQLFVGALQVPSLQGCSLQVQPAAQMLQDR